MSAEHRLLGFDAREITEVNSNWSNERRSTYLLRNDIERVLSTDTMVWPSALGADESVESSSASVNSFLLRNGLLDLKRYLATTKNRTRKPFWIVGIALLWNVLNHHERELWEPRLTLTDPPALDASWSFLGYDVSDLALISGLSNCGYDTDALPSLKERWGPHLNRFHLFTDGRQALEFKIMTDDRVPEHAPFFVYGLYLVEHS